MRHNTYKPIQQVRDRQPIRTTCFHPSGESYVVGTNSKVLKICRYPNRQRIEELLEDQLSADGGISEPEISFTCLHIHCASVYCASFNPSGHLLATGSNDQTVHVIKYDSESHAPGGDEYKLSSHTGTVRDVCFMGEGVMGATDMSISTAQTTTAMLLSAGCGQYEINLTDCEVMQLKQSFKVHQSTVMSVHACRDSATMFVSGSLDGTIRIWDVRCNGPVMTAFNKSQSLHNLPVDGDSVTGTNDNAHDEAIARSHDYQQNQEQQQQQQQQQRCNQENLKPSRGSDTLILKHGSLQSRTTTKLETTPRKREHLIDRAELALAPVGVPVGVVRLDPTGRLLVSGHQDGSCMLHDVRANKSIQTFRAHEGEIRTLNFSPNFYYILTGGYDRKIRLADIQGRLANPLPSVELIEQNDKVVQTAWHPFDYNFVSTCADGSATLWTIWNFDELTQSFVV